MEELKKKVDEALDSVQKDGIDTQNLDVIYKLIDVKKDIFEIEKLKEETNMYREGYGRGNYGRRRRDSRGRYMEGGQYGRESYGHYPEEMIERMHEGYNGYSEGNEEFNRTGNYGAKDESMESLEYMLESLVQFFEHIQKNAENKEEMELIKKYAKKIKEM